jgi:hypothetical protein
MHQVSRPSEQNVSVVTVFYTKHIAEDTVSREGVYKVHSRLLEVRAKVPFVKRFKSHKFACQFGVLADMFL